MEIINLEGGNKKIIHINEEILNEKKLAFKVMVLNREHQSLTKRIKEIEEMINLIYDNVSPEIMAKYSQGIIKTGSCEKEVIE